MPFWIWFGPISILGLSALMFKLQPGMMPAAMFACLLGIFFSAEFKMKGVGFSSILLVLVSLLFYKNIAEPIATYWLYAFGLITSFLITAYSVEEYESFIYAQAEESKKNSEDLKLWQSRFEGNQIRLEREKERYEKIFAEYEKQEDSYLEKIDQLEKMFHSSTYELKQEQNRGYNLHQELKKLLIEKYDIQVANTNLSKELEDLNLVLQSERNGFNEQIESLNFNLSESLLEIERVKANLLSLEFKKDDYLEESLEEEEIIDEIAETYAEEPISEVTPSMIFEEASKQMILDNTVDSTKVEPTEEEENIYFSSF